MSISQKSLNASDVTIRSLRDELDELDTADRIFRVAFGTSFGMPNDERQLVLLEYLGQQYAH